MTERHEGSSSIMHRTFSSGLCFDAVRPIVTDRPKLVGMEQTIEREIRRRLTFPHSVNVLDMGSMLGTSCIAVATHFSEEIGQGRVRMIVTNAESFSVERSLADARNRLGKQKKAGIRRIVPDEETLAFVAKHHHLVRFLSGVDTLKLKQNLENIGVSSLHIVHEHTGDLQRHPAKSGALSVVSALLVEDGALYTRERIDAGGSYGPLEGYGLRPEQGYPLGYQGYRAYRKNTAYAE